MKVTISLCGRRGRVDHRIFNPFCYLCSQLKLHMRNLFLFAIAAAALAGCKKSGDTAKPGDTNNTTGLSGKYAAFKSADTSFKDQIRGHGVSGIEVITLTGDTLYQNLDTAHPVVSVNIIQNYSPSMITDTLTFNSATTGIESSQKATYPFSYDISSGKYNAGDTTPDTFYSLTKIDDTTLKLVIYQTSGIYTGDVSCTLYKKFQ